MKSAAVLIACLIAGDIAGVVALTIADVVGVLFPALAYVVWLVFGVFTGLIAYDLAGRWSAASAGGGSDEWTARAGAGRLGWVIVTTDTAVIAAFAFVFYHLYWSRGVAGDYYVPDSGSHSIAFFVAVAGAILSGRLFLMPDNDRARPKR